MLLWFSVSCAINPNSAPPLSHTNPKSARAPVTMYKVSMLPCNYTERVWSSCANMAPAQLHCHSLLPSNQEHLCWSTEVTIISAILKQRWWQEMKCNSETKKNNRIPLTLHHTWSKDAGQLPHPIIWLNCYALHDPRPPTHLSTEECKHKAQRVRQQMPVINPPLHTTLVGDQHYVTHKVVGVQLISIGQPAWDDCR